MSLSRPCGWSELLNSSFDPPLYRNTSTSSVSVPPQLGSLLMRLMTSLLVILSTLISSAAFAQTYAYGPSEVTLYGTLISAPGETPDGAKITYPALELVLPITVSSTPGDELFEPTEKGVMLIHLALDKETADQFVQLKGRRIAATGNLFHSDNGHHQTDVLLLVKALSAAR